MTATEISPRNPWARAKQAMALAEKRRFTEAYQVLENIRYHPDVSAQAFLVFERRLEDMAQCGDSVPRINTPADYLRHPHLGLRAPFPRIEAGARVPSPYPPTMALPQLVGVQNSTTFLQDAATVLAPHVAGRLSGAHVILSAMEPEAVRAVLQDLSRQSYGGDIAVTVFADAPGDVTAPGNISLKTVSHSLLSAQGTNQLRALIDAPEDALMVFLSGQVQLDPTALERAAHSARVTDALVQPLVPFEGKARLQSPFSDRIRSELFAGLYPFRDMQGMNFVAPTGLLRRSGLPDTRFGSTFQAARELAFRMMNQGMYFAPLEVPALTPARDDKAPQNSGDGALYQNLCPNHWGRKRDGLFEVPRVSVYIPAYNASRYIRRAVDSVLDQDVQDLEVCICNDGSRDNTADLLQKHYGDNPRVKWQNRRNGGIGTGSNAAIHLSSGPYVGQLDSDDALKPRAVRRMMEFLDEHPDTACVYGSCERIDADGAYIKDEYSWPVFSREKMMITSIAHHFRMFRRSCWERTSKFREDIVNGIDYDIFLKLSETGPMHHIDEIMYQRRWHGENTSVVNESHQTANTHRVQNETLKRLGMDRFWEVHVPNPAEPRRVTYRRKADTRTVLFWPDYSRSNPYQQMLYREARKTMEICAGDIDAALKLTEELDDPSHLTFHLHWLNFLFLDISDATEAQARADAFLDKLSKFVWRGGRLVWTIHNQVSHDTPFYDVEVKLSEAIAGLAHALHFHAAGSVADVAEVFDIPREKVVVVPHGHYIGAYPDFVDRRAARDALGIAQEDEVIVFTGQVRPYKGVEALIAAFRQLLKKRPKARLLIAGEMKFDLFGEVKPALTRAEAARITATERFVGDLELQLFLRSADVAVYPYEKILTSGSLMLALGFGLPVVIPDVAMTRATLDNEALGVPYDTSEGEKGLEAAILSVLDRGAAATKLSDPAALRVFADAAAWTDVTSVLQG